MENKKEWVDWLNTKVLQKAVVIDEAGNILILKRVETGPASRPSKKDLPGGSIGPEDLVNGVKPHEEAIKREILQETGLEASEIKIIFIDSWQFEKSTGKILGLAIGYQVKVSGIKPEIKLSDEHIESYWLPKDEASNSDFGEDGSLHKSIITNSSMN